MQRVASTATASHAVQHVVVASVMLIDFVALLLTNRLKANGGHGGKLWSWRRKRWAFHALMVTLVGSAAWMDVHYHITAYFHIIKAYVFAFSVGILDLYFSDTTGVPLKVCVGGALWCSTALIRQALVDHVWPNGGGGLGPVIVQEVTIQAALVELLRYVTMLALVGLLSDLFFSPFHRISHLPSLYKGNHKVHHEYTRKLTALVLYHGSLLDDFLMPFSTAIGGFLYVYLLSMAGLEAEAYSNVSGYLIICNTLMSHGHDVRCARLMAPLPDAVNFVAYHYVHHLSPCNNYGLTEPSDVLWDAVLGVRTIRKLEDFEPAEDAKAQ